MTMLDGDSIKLINDALEAILLNQAYSPIVFKDASDETEQLAARINRLAECVRQVNDFIVDLSKGMLNIDPPPRNNYLASAAKQLHSHLNHLTWQTQQIAQGDYRQKVDFMGDFAVAFNTMTKQLQEREESLKAHNELIGTVFDHIECLLILNADNRYEAFYINRSAEKEFNLENTLNLAKRAGSSHFINQLINLDVNDGAGQELFDSDTKQFYSVIVSQLRWTDNSPAVLFYCMNITHHKQRESTLERDAHTDALTGIFNRRAFDMYIKRDLQHAKRLGMHISLLIIDIDFFKAYNDTYGHLQGDVCLMMVAKCIRSTVCRSTDFVARFGGEEFVALLPNTDSDSAVKLAEKIRMAVEKLKVPNKCIADHYETTGVTVSVGICSVVPTDETTTSQMLHAADVALYHSKKSGRNRVTLAEE